MNVDILSEWRSLNVCYFALSRLSTLRILLYYQNSMRMYEQIKILIF